MKKILKYSVPALVSVMICMALLFVTSLIPKNAIESNCKENAAFYSQNELFDSVAGGYFFARQDNYADCILNNVIYHIDSEHPVTSSLQAAYYSPKLENVNESFQNAVDGTIEDKEDNYVNYYRYWHGSMVILRPLLIFFTITQIRMLLGVLAIVGGILTAVLLWRQRKKELAIIYLLALLAVDIWMTCFCIEYVTTFLVLNGIMTALLIQLGKKKNIEDTDFLSLFCVSGIITAFVDFLTTETITFTIPVFILLVYLYQEEKIKGYKDSFLFMIKNGISWLLGYGGMFLLKWIISAILFGGAAIKTSFAQAAVRIGGEVNLGSTSLDPIASKGQQLSGAIWHNLGCLYHIKNTLNAGSILLITFIIVFVTFCLIYLFHSKKLEGKFILPVLLLAVLPYLRYLVLSNHAYLHYFFTYRAQMITVIIILYLLWEYAGMGLMQLIQGKRK